MGKRKGSALAAAFAKASQAAAGQKLPPLEAAADVRSVPEEFLQELEKQYAQYKEQQGKISDARNKAAEQAQKQQQQQSSTRGRAAAASADPNNNPLGDIATSSNSHLQITVTRWHSSAAYCIRQLAAWAGSSTGLQPALQECLLHFVANADLHSDPLLSLQAYRLLQRNLQAHPPATVQQLSGAAHQPPVLLQNQAVWHPMADASSRDFADCLGGKAKFALLQELVCNAGLIVTGSSGSSSSSGGGAAPSQGKALLLLYVTQVLQADCLVRLGVFEQHLAAAAQRSDQQEQQQAAQERAAVLLRHSLLWRLIEHDGSWNIAEIHSRGKHNLVRELLRIIASNGGSSAASQAAPAAAADAVPQPVSAQELVQAARQLLLLLLQLYSNAEEAGVYGSNGDRHHAQRGLAARANDRFEMDEVMRLALAGGRMLPELQDPAALLRLLRLLPPIHRSRLVAVVVAEAIANRPYDDPVPSNPHLEGLHAYCVDRGRGYASFKQGNPLEVIRAVSDRQEWAAKEVLGGKDAFAVMACSLVSAALPGQLLVQAEERQEFQRLAGGVLQHVRDHSRARLVKQAAGGCCSEVALALATALQQCGVGLE